MIESRSTRNNFDLIRLLAASQVAITHSAEHLNLHSWVFDALRFFPGAPIFFFISGYLIYASYANIKGPARLQTFFHQSPAPPLSGLVFLFRGNSPVGLSQRLFQHGILAPTIRHMGRHFADLFPVLQPGFPARL